jgi:hypothetical protein
MIAKAIYAGIDALDLISGLAACGTASVPAAAPRPTVTVTAPVRVPATPTPPKTITAAPAPTKTVTPRHQLAAALVGSVNEDVGWNDDADITIISATVSTICSSDTGWPYGWTTGRTRPSCSGVVPGQISISDWQDWDQFSWSLPLILKPRCQTALRKKFP